MALACVCLVMRSCQVSDADCTRTVQTHVQDWQRGPATLACRTIAEQVVRLLGLYVRDNSRWSLESGAAAMPHLVKLLVERKLYDSEACCGSSISGNSDGASALVDAALGLLLDLCDGHKNCTLLCDKHGAVKLLQLRRLGCSTVGRRH